MKYFASFQGVARGDNAEVPATMRSIPHARHFRMQRLVTSRGDSCDGLKNPHQKIVVVLVVV